MKIPCRLLSIMAPIAGIMFFSGCSSVCTTVNPGFDMSNYHTVSIDSRGSAQFLYHDVKEVLFDEIALSNSEKKKSPQSHDAYSKHQKSSKKLDLLDTSAKEPDLYVLVTVDEGVALPPDIINHYKPVFVQPKKATVELWDAITKKQLLLCTFSRFWGGIGSYDYCRETLVKELKRALDELKTKEKLAAPTPQPTVEVIP